MSFCAYGFQGFVVTPHPESGETIDAGFGRKGMTAVRLAFADVGDVDFDDGNADRADAVGNGDGGVGVCAGIHHNGVVDGISFLQFVDDVSFVIGLIIVQFMLWEPLLELFKICLKRSVSVYFGFSFAEQIEVRTVDY